MCAVSIFGKVVGLLGCIASFLQDTKETGHISDRNTHLFGFCQCVEAVFNNGLLQQTTFPFTKTTSAWSWLEKCASVKHNVVTFTYVSAVEEAKKYKYILTNAGKLRLLIRICLNEKCLHVPVQYLVNELIPSSLYKQSSVLGDEILSEIYLSVLLQCSKISFKLDTSNNSFLNSTWILPELLRLEMVPCRSLGITVSFVDDKAVIVKISSNSIVSENGRIAVGDVLDNLNGIHICSVTKGRLESILRVARGQPIIITVVKAKYSDTNELFPGIITLLKKAKVDVQAVRNGSNLNSTELSKSDLKTVSAGFKITYIGYISTGKTGEIKKIDKAIRHITSPFSSTRNVDKWEKLNLSVYFEVAEMGVKVISSQTSEVTLKHSYMEISSCGSAANISNYFAYIVGNDLCNVATEFFCHVFYAGDQEVACTILQSIGQGFHRTHFAV